jgi:hypothetical protein
MSNPRTRLRTSVSPFPQEAIVTASSLPTRRLRLRTAAAGFAMAVAAFTATACSGDDTGTGTENEVVEEGEVGVGEEDAGQVEDVAPEGDEEGADD